MVIWTTKKKKTIVLDIETNPFTCGWLAPEPGKTFMDYPLDIRVAVVYEYDTDTYHTFNPNELQDFFDMVASADRVVSFNGEGFDFKVMKALGFKEEISDSVDLCHRIKEYTGAKYFTSLDSIAKEHFGRRKQTKGRDMVNLDYQKLAKACQVDVEITKQIYENRQHWKKNTPNEESRRSFNNNEPDFTETEDLVFKALKMSREYTPEWMNWAKNHLRKVIFKGHFHWLPKDVRDEILVSLKDRINATVPEYVDWKEQKLNFHVQSSQEYKPKIDALPHGNEEYEAIITVDIPNRTQELIEEKYSSEQIEKFNQMEDDRNLLWNLLRHLNSLYYISPEYILDIVEHDITHANSVWMFKDKSHWSYIHRTPKMQYAKNLNYHHQQNKRRHKVNYRITDVLDKYPDCKSIMCEYYYNYYDCRIPYYENDMNNIEIEDIKETIHGFYKYGVPFSKSKWKKLSKKNKLQYIIEYYIGKYKSAVTYHYDGLHLLLDPNFNFDTEKIDSWIDDLEKGLPPSLLDKINQAI